MLLLLGLLGSGLALSLGISGRLSALLLLLLDVLSSFLDGLLEVRLGVLLLVVVRRIGVLFGLLVLPRSQSLHALRSFVTDSRGLLKVSLLDVPIGELANESLAAARIIGITLLVLSSASFGGDDLFEADVELDSSATLGLKLVSGRSLNAQFLFQKVRGLIDLLLVVDSSLLLGRRLVGVGAIAVGSLLSRCLLLSGLLDGLGLLGLGLNRGSLLVALLDGCGNSGLDDNLLLFGLGSLNLLGLFDERELLGLGGDDGLRLLGDLLLGLDRLGGCANLLLLRSGLDSPGGRGFSLGSSLALLVVLADPRFSFLFFSIVTMEKLEIYFAGKDIVAEINGFWKVPRPIKSRVKCRPFLDTMAKTRLILLTC